jgi:hypothetical protein
MGVYAAAEQAIQQGVREICVAEFGVAGGNGLLALEAAAREVEDQLGVKILVYGFDSGKGLPPPQDYRDHPDAWVCGDYPMDVKSLTNRLSSRTKLILGDIAETVADFVESMQQGPLGFAAMDLDLYTSTRHALEVFSHPNKSMLNRCYLYFDDIALPYCHRYAGELLAIDEFNQVNNHVKIDRWYSLPAKVVFRDGEWVTKMYIAHDLVGLSHVRGEREPDETTFRLFHVS